MATVEEAVQAEAAEPQQRGLCLCESYARATERAALGAARWLGRANDESAEKDAADAMRRALDNFQIQGKIVIGSAEDDSPLRVGEEIGAGGQRVDLAVDPLEGRGIVARGGNGAMSMIAVGEPGSLLNLPDMYMRKMAVGPRARGTIDLLKPMNQNIAAIARMLSPTGFVRSIEPRALGPTAILRMYMSGRRGNEPGSPTATIDIAP